MNNIERRQTILGYLREKGSVNTIDLAKELNVSSMTIRRDLSRFADEGIVSLEYGGAILIDGSLHELSMNMKQDERQQEKQRIAAYCAQRVHNGDTVFLDAGTTVAEIAKLLTHHSDLTVMTHSLLVANILANASDVRLIMCPGIFRSKSMAFMGQLTDDFVSSFKIDTLFLGVEGVEVDHGTSTPDVTDGITKTALVNASSQIICAADSSKIGKITFYSICPIRDITTLVTDKNVDPAQVRALEENGLEVILA